MVGEEIAYEATLALCNPSIITCTVMYVPVQQTCDVRALVVHVVSKSIQNMTKI